MMDILQKIIANKQFEVSVSKSNIPTKQLEKYPFFERTTHSLVSSLNQKNSSGIIAEHKRKSPSKGIINDKLCVEDITSGYVSSNAAGLSILTDYFFFGGQKNDLINSRKVNQNIPILRKDFIIDEYQLFEAKAWGADVVLLIAACLSTNQIYSLSKKAKLLNLEVLLEVHDWLDLIKSPLEYIDLIGVNNRNLKNFSENTVDASIALAENIPNTKTMISESCISHPDTVRNLKNMGYKGFLIGETFMKTTNPASALENFIKQVAA